MKAIASTRKFDRYGDWHYFWYMPAVLPGVWRKARGGSERARGYWYGDR